MNFTSILLLTCFVLCILFVIMLKITISFSRKNKELKDEIEKLSKIKIQKEKINTGNNYDDFKSTIELLQEYSKKRN